MDSEKRERDILERIGRPRKPPSSNKDEEYEGEEEDVRATQNSIEDNSPISEYEEGCEFYQEDNRKDTVLSDAKNAEEEASSRHKGESSSSYSLERSDDNDEDDEGTVSKYKNCYGNGNGDGGGRGDRKTGAG